jgi:hypothetical protein
MAAELTNSRPFVSFEQWEWDWLRADLSIDQIAEGFTMVFEYGRAPSHGLLWNVLEAARSRVEDGLPPYGNLWEEASEEERRLYMEESKKRLERYGEEYNL